MDTVKSIKKNNQSEVITNTSIHEQVVATNKKYSKHFTKFQIKKMDNVYSTTLGTTNTYSYIWKRLQVN